MNKNICMWDEFLQKYRPFVDSGVPSHLRHHQGGDRKMKKSEIGTYIWNSFVNPYTRSWKYPIYLHESPSLSEACPEAQQEADLSSESWAPDFFSFLNTRGKKTWLDTKSKSTMTSQLSSPCRQEERSPHCLMWENTGPAPPLWLGREARTAIQMCLAAVGAHKQYQLQQRQWTSSATRLPTG